MNLRVPPLSLGDGVIGDDRLQFVSEIQVQIQTRNMNKEQSVNGDSIYQKGFLRDKMALVYRKSTNIQSVRSSCGISTFSMTYSGSINYRHGRLWHLSEHTASLWWSFVP